jgi:hypothetical protein
MRIVRLFAIAVAFTLGTSVLARAQEHGKAGVTVGYPGDIGILWHASDAIAIRPTFTFSHTSSDTTGGSSSDGWGAGIGVAALIYLKKYDNVRAYVSPQFSYTHTTLTSTPPAGVTSVTQIDSTNHATGGAGAFGAQFTPTAHFSVYGEFGIGFAHSKSNFSGNVSTTTGTATSWGTFAGVGIVFYP